jgi:dTDP-4-dehydrorhamnose 3,5-epimerase
LRISPTRLPEVLLLTPDVFRDERGFFLESWRSDRFNRSVGRDVTFVQDNHSRSRRGVLRGLHYQTAPEEQAKLITVMQGRIFDVAVDVRNESPTFGQWVGEVLTDESRESLWIPEGFAHGFLVLSETADVVYKTTAFYSPDHERCIKWDDQCLAICWPDPGVPLIISAKDLAAESITKCGVKVQRGNVRGGARPFTQGII